MKRYLLVLVFFITLPSVLFADWNIVKEKSSIGFTAYSRMHNAEGVFHKWDFSGNVKDNWTGRGKMEVDIASIDTNDSKRDKHLKAPDFFNAGSFPKASYEIKSMKASGDHVDVTGVLTIMGTSKPLNIKMTKVEKGGEASLVGEADINRMEYGVKGNSNFNPIQPKVTLKLNLTLKK